LISLLYGLCEKVQYFPTRSYAFAMLGIST